jgi:hypothetical protein
MRPGITSNVIAELEAHINRPVWLFEADFAGGWLYLTTHRTNLTWNSHTYLGNGVFQGVRGINETLSTQTSGCEVIMSGVSNEMLVRAMDSTLQGKPGTIYLAFLDSDFSIISSPLVIFDGIVDVPKIIERQNGSDLTLSLDSKEALFERPKGYRYNSKTQEFLYPGDTGFRYALTLDQRTLTWGKKEEPTSTAKENRKRANSNRRSTRKANVHA